MNNNQITTIDPKAFSECTGLSEIDLRNNQITTIDAKTFSKCTGLSRINLSNNQITTIDAKAFSACKELSEIDLNNNQITTIDPKAFSECTGLSGINLSNNQITTFDAKAFSACKELSEIDLRNNQITTIDAKTFSECTRLSELYLSNNQITTIDANLFSGCYQLKWINLRNNQIKKFDANVFFSCKCLNAIYLNNNYISEFDFKIIDKLNEKSEIDLRNNINLTDLPFMFDQFFEILNAEKINEDLFKSSSFFRPPLFPSKFFSNEFCEKYKEFSFIFLKADAIKNRLFSLFLNNRIYSVKDLKKSFNDVIEKINKLRSNPISVSILDIFLSFEEQLDSNWIITFENFVDTYLKENQLVVNIVFKLRSSDSMEYFFKRNDLIFFENYFSSQIIVPQSTENDYIEDTKTFYLNVNLIECFDIIIVKENEKMANYFFKILKFILNNYGFTTQIEEFNKVLLNEFLKEIFDEKKWWLIEIILNDEENIFYQDENSNLGINSRHLDLLLDNNQSAEKTKKRKEKKESHQYQKKKESFLNKKLLEITNPNPNPTRIEDPKEEADESDKDAVEEADDNAYENYHENLSNKPNSPINTNQMKQKKM